ncbi:MAG: hypothetical protein KF716_09575 [Anaerolineae bacterium]|nr:hypothetical protein [Anaerolineae bacterium]
MAKLWLITLGLLIVAAISAMPLQRDYSQASTATIAVAATMDSAPTDCGQLAVPTVIDPHAGGGIGAWPLWVGIPNWSGQSRGILVFPTTHYQESDVLIGWWVTKMGWFVSETYKGEVKLQAYYLTDHSPMYFEFANEPTTLASINPANPGGFTDEMQGCAFFPSLIWVSKAGCYQLEATWDGGMWRQVIAIGSSAG